MSCSNNIRANSAHQVDQNQLSRGERSLPLVGGTLPHPDMDKSVVLVCTCSIRVPSDQIPRTATSLGKFAAGSCHELQSMVVVTGDLVRQDLLHPTLRHCLQDRARMDFSIFSFANLATMSSYPDFQNLLNLVFWFTKSRFSVQ